MKNFKFVLLGGLLLVTEMLFAQQQGREHGRGGQGQQSSPYVQTINTLIEKVIQANKPFSPRKAQEIESKKGDLEQCSNYRRELVAECVGAKSEALIDLVLAKEPQRPNRNCETTRVWEPTQGYSYNYQYIQLLGGVVDPSYLKVYTGTVVRIIGRFPENANLATLVQVEVQSQPEPSSAPVGKTGYLWAGYLKSVCQ